MVAIKIAQQDDAMEAIGSYIKPSHHDNIIMLIIHPTIGYIRDHGIKYLLRRQPANALCHGPADPWRCGRNQKNN
jgi:hypothetical protein